MSEEQNSSPQVESAEPAQAATSPPRKAPRSPRRKPLPALPAGEGTAKAATPPGSEPAPKTRRTPRKPRVSLEHPAPDTVTADLFASPEAPAEAVAEELLPEVAPDDVAAEGMPLPDAAPLDADSADEDGAATSGDEPSGPRRKRKRRRGKSERDDDGVATEQIEMPGLTETPAAPEEDTASVEPPEAQEAVEASLPEADVPPAAPPRLTVVSLGLDLPPALSAAALASLRAAPLILGAADALKRLAGLGLEAPLQPCEAHSVATAVRGAGHGGSVLVVVGDGAGDGPGAELVAELGPDQVRMLPGVGRVQAACAALGLSAEKLTVVDLRRAPLASLRGRLRAHCLLALPLADADGPLRVARLVVEGGFAGARMWVCESCPEGLRVRAWLAGELADLHETFDPRAVLILATGASAGVFAEVPGLPDSAFGDEAAAALPLAARALAMAWLQPAAWEQGWAISEGEASLALEWARAVPTARVRAVGMAPAVLNVHMARAGVGENLAAIPAASPPRCREWPQPDAVFIRGGAGLGDWLEAAWERLAPGGRLVATAEDDQARADLLAFSGRVPAAAWQELSLSRGETVAGRLRFAPSAPLRLALWRKPGLS